MFLRLVSKLQLKSCAVRNTTVGLEHVETPADMKMWPLFHNGVATGLRIAQGISQVWSVRQRKKMLTAIIDLMYNDVTRPERQYGIYLHSQSQDGGQPWIWRFRYSGSNLFDPHLKAQTNRPSRYSTAQPNQNTFQHYCHLNFPLRGNATPCWIRL